MPLLGGTRVPLHFISTTIRQMCPIMFYIIYKQLKYRLLTTDITCTFNSILIIKDLKTIKKL